jgi:hypothetical protein
MVVAAACSAEGEWRSVSVWIVVVAGFINVGGLCLALGLLRALCTSVLYSVR